MVSRRAAAQLSAAVLALLASSANAQLQTTAPPANNTVQTTIPPTNSSMTSTNSNSPPGTITSPTNFQRTNVTNIDPLAVCNDATPGFYYFRPGTGAGANKWVIRLEGGGWCYDQATCVLRYSAQPNLMSSASQYFPNTLGGGAVLGVLDGDPRANPNMNLWNHVSIGYCSSDSYLGDAAPGDTTETGIFQFRGQRIVNATIRSLLATQGLSQATQILFVGVSAGAVGAFSLADPVYSILKPNAPNLSTFKTVVDAGWFMDIPSYSGAASAFSFRKCATGLVQNFKATFDPTCSAAFANDTWACFFAQYAWPYISTPTIFHEYLYDSANLGYDSAGNNNQVEDLRSKLKTSFTTPANQIQPPSNTASSGTVSTSSIQPGPSITPGGGRPTLPTLPNLNANAPGPTSIYAPGMSNLPPSAIPRGVPPAPPPPPAPPAPPSPPPGPPQQSSSPSLPGPLALGTSQLPQVFSPACNNHDISDNLLFPVSKIGSSRFVDVLNAWFTMGNVTLPAIDPTVGIASGVVCLMY